MIDKLNDMNGEHGWPSHQRGICRWIVLDKERGGGEGGEGGGE